MHSQVVGLLQLCPCRKYCGFSMTGMRLMPITTASGPASREQGVTIPWLTWWRGLAESSSPLMTATGPVEQAKNDDKCTRQARGEDILPQHGFDPNQSLTMQTSKHFHQVYIYLLWNWQWFEIFWNFPPGGENHWAQLKNKETAGKHKIFKKPNSKHDFSNQLFVHRHTQGSSLNMGNQAKHQYRVTKVLHIGLKYLKTFMW